MRLAFLVASLGLVGGCILSGDDSDDGTDGPLPICGDGVRNGAETCDDGNNEDEDGCAADCTLEEVEPGHVTASWTFEQLANGNEVGCPPGVDTIVIVSQPISATGVPTGEPIPEMFACEDDSGVTGPLPAGNIAMYLEARNGNTLVATTEPDEIDITETDGSLDFTFYTDGGVFYFQWTLKGQNTGNTLTCANVPMLDGIGMIATLSGTTQGIDMPFDCEDGANTTDPLLNGDYVLSVDAFREDGTSIGTAPAINATLSGLNPIVDIGEVVIPITGQ